MSASRRRPVPPLRRDGDPTTPAPQKGRRIQTFSATGGDTGVGCSRCGRRMGFVEGGTMMGAVCNVCAGLAGRGEDLSISTSLTGERVRTNLAS